MVLKTTAVSLGRPKDSSTPAVPFPSEPKFEKTNFADLSLHPMVERSLNGGGIIGRKNSARSSTSTVGPEDVTVLVVPSRGDLYMDETLVYGTTGHS